MNRNCKNREHFLGNTGGHFPPFNLRHPDPANTLNLGLSVLEAAGESVLTSPFCPRPSQRQVFHPNTSRWLQSRSLVIRYLRRRPRPSVLHVRSSRLLRCGRNGMCSDCAVLFDRTGQIVGTYSKQHPTEDESG